MASKVEICNIALTDLGKSSITSLTDNNERARACNLIYDQIAAEVMANGWSSNTVRATLAQTTTTPTYEFSYEFQLPTDPKCLKVLRINEASPGEYNYKIEGDKLLINITSVSIKYAAELDDSESYGVFLTQSIIAALRARLAFRLTGNATLSKNLTEIYNDVLADSMASDGQQGVPDGTPSNTLTDIR